MPQRKQVKLPSSYSDDRTDKMLASLEKDIQGVYDRANKEMQEKINKYWADLKERDAEKRELLKQGEIKQEEYDKWKAQAVMHGKRQEQIRDSLANDYTQANIRAMAIVNNQTADVFALNYNYSAYTIEREVEVNLSYKLHDKNTVDRLVKEKPDLLPAPKVNIEKDKRWNKQKITAEITQGIVQGESIPDISKRLQKVTDMNRSAAIRNARTAVTGAQNAGRAQSHQHAVEMGIKMNDEWAATLDGRTRHSHAILDGEVIEVGGTFSNGLKYPGDPNGDPAEIYQCRCTIVPIIAGTSFPKGKYGNGKLGEMSYDTWKDLHWKAEYGTEAEKKQAEKQLGTLNPPKKKKTAKNKNGKK